MAKKKHWLFKEIVNTDKLTRRVDSPLRGMMSFLFPHFSELQFVLFSTVILTAPVKDQPLIVSFLSIIFEPFVNGTSTVEDWKLVGILAFYTLLIILGVVIPLARKQTIPRRTKVVILIMFYAVFMLCAAFANSDIKQNMSFIESLNTMLIKACLLLAIIRGLTAVFMARLESDYLDQLLTQNFSDEQMRAYQFVLAVVIAVGAAIILTYLGNKDMGQVIVLGYVYSYGVYKLIDAIAKFGIAYRNLR